MEYISFGGTRYACPFTSDFPPLTEDEESYLRQSINEIGIVNEVLTYDSEENGPCVIQGRNRIRIAASLGLPIPVRDLGRIPDDEAKKHANDVQAAGRQLSPSQVEQARRRRVEKILNARMEGKSIRTIAAETGVNRESVRRVVSGDTVVSPDFVRGADGKTYPTKREAAPDDDDDSDTPVVVEPSPAEQREQLRQDAETAVDRCLSYLGLIEDDLAFLLAGPLGNKLSKRAEKAGEPFPDGGVWAPIAAIRRVLG